MNRRLGPARLGLRVEPADGLGKGPVGILHHQHRMLAEVGFWIDKDEPGATLPGLRPVLRIGKKAQGGRPGFFQRLHLREAALRRTVAEIPPKSGGQFLGGHRDRGGGGHGKPPHEPSARTGGRVASPAPTLLRL